MNRKKLERHLKDHGCFFHHHGGDHDVWWNAHEVRSAPVPRHKEVAAYTARAICRELGIPVPSEK